MPRAALPTTLFALFVTTLAGSAHAEGWPEERHRVLPCRPTVSCTADIVPPGSFEIEAGYLARRAPPGGFVHAEPLLLKLSLTTWLQLQAGMNGEVFTTGQVTRAQRYLDDVSLGVKLHFLDQGPLSPSFAVSGALSIPSWERPADFPYAYDASFWAYVSKDLGPLHLDLNGGLNVWQFDVAPSTQAFVTLASALALDRHFGVLLEGYAFEHGGAIAPRDAGVLSGVTYSPVPWWMIDVGGDVGLVPSTRSFSLFVGLTTVIHDFWDTDAEKLAASPGEQARAAAARSVAQITTVTTAAHRR